MIKNNLKWVNIFDHESIDARESTFESLAIAGNKFSEEEKICYKELFLDLRKYIESIVEEESTE